jgi:protein-disulfide isomerase
LEYASLSCSHCAHFHEDVLPDLQKKYIDQGKLKVVFRHFPLNAPALRASQMVACMPKSQQHALLSDLFKQQNDWAFSENFLSEIKLIAGKHQVDSAAFDSCMKDTAIENKIIQSRQKADALGMVSGTPTFYINGVKYEEVQRVSGFSKAIDAALNAAAKTVK